MNPMPVTSRRYQLIDVARGLICLWVVVDHAGFALHWTDTEVRGIEGWLRYPILWILRLGLGPSLFFVISGYCIAASAESTRRQGGSALEFLARRAWRTFPPYWAALLGFVSLVLVLEGTGLGWLYRNLFALELPSPTALTGPQWLGNLTLTETWRPLVGGGEANVLTRVAWSLCYQEQFYFICFLALACGRDRMHRVLGIVTAATLAYRVFAWDSGRLARIDGSFSMFWHEFAVGLVVYWRLHRAESARERRAMELGLAGLLTLGLMMRMPTTAAAAGLGLLLIAARPYDARLATWPGFGPLRACGRRCYSIYLVHLPICVLGCAGLTGGLGLTDFWVRALVVVPTVSAAAVGVSWAFHAAVERRFLDLPACWSARSNRPSASPTPRPAPTLAAAA